MRTGPAPFLRFFVLAAAGLCASSLAAGSFPEGATFFLSPAPRPTASIALAAAGKTEGFDPGGSGSEERLTSIEQAMVSRDRASLPLLREWATRDEDERVRERSIGALSLIRDPESAGIFLDRLSRDPSPRVRRAAAEAIGILKLSDRYASLADILEKDPDPYVRAECARALGRIAAKQGGNALMVALVKDPSAEVRALSVEALSALRAPESPELLRVVAQQDPSTLVRIYAVQALFVVDPVGSFPVFRSVWEGTTDPDLRVAAFQGLLLSGRSGQWESEGLADFDERVRFLAFRSWLSHAIPSRAGFASPPSADTVAGLESFLKDPLGGIRELAREALEQQGFRIRPDGFGYVIDR